MKCKIVKLELMHVCLYIDADTNKAGLNEEGQEAVFYLLVLCTVCNKQCNISVLPYRNK